ncbi:MAG: TVP38/TMEM64 family protein [Clostridiales bacterium]|nr:TVP38/TMEM64 family protein [Clostridiales bacterium]
MLEKKTKHRVELNAVLAVVFIAAAVYAGIRFGPYIIQLAKEPQLLKERLNSYGPVGVLIFIAIQTFQVIVAIIPGEVVQIAGGYIYGAIPGTIYSLIGIAAGSVMVFYIARFLGYSLVKSLVPPETLNKFNFLMNSNKTEIIMFILFLIPGLPKDFLTYIAGVTPIKPLRFFAVIIIGRLPGLFGSSYIGYYAQKGNYTIMIILSAAALVVFVAGLLNKDRIISHLHRHHKKKDEVQDNDKGT